MRQSVLMFGSVLVSGVLAAPAGAKTCPPDSVLVANFCVDTYEASVWEVPAGNSILIKKIKKGTATRANLRAEGTQRGVGTDGYSCEDTGNDCSTIYAVSIAGVKPSASITWFQAQQACLNAGKRLLTNAEWQGAAAGTPDPGKDNGSTDCNITDDGWPANDPVNTGSRTNCVSRWGVFDMVGNVMEWVADWMPLSTGCINVLFSKTGDEACVGGMSTTRGPSALLRGGDFSRGTGSGVFAVNALDPPSDPYFFIGFRCAR